MLTIRGTAKARPGPQPDTNSPAHHTARRPVLLPFLQNQPKSFAKLTKPNRSLRSSFFNNLAQCSRILTLPEFRQATRKSRFPAGLRNSRWSSLRPALKTNDLEAGCQALFANRHHGPNPVRVCETFSLTQLKDSKQLINFASGRRRQKTRHFASLCETSRLSCTGPQLLAYLVLSHTRRKLIFALHSVTR